MQQRRHLDQVAAGLGQAVKVAHIPINSHGRLGNVLGVVAVHLEPLVDLLDLATNFAFEGHGSSIISRL